MSKAAFSVFVFSIYLFVLGAILVVIPNFLLSVFGIPETDEVWIRVVGMLVFVLGYYYFTAARNGLSTLFRATVVARLAALGFFVVFAVLELAPPVLILFGVIDAVAAVWTGISLRERAVL